VIAAMSDDESTEFVRQAREQRGKSPSIVREFWCVVAGGKKWWLAPLCWCCCYSPV
jgi:hypothetical protein